MSIGAQKKAVRDAFSLLELLIVISGVAILVGIFLPVISRTSQAGKEARAISTMRNVLHCMSLSQIDNGKAYYRKMAKGGRLYWFQYYISEYCDFDATALRSPFDSDWDERLEKQSYTLLPSDRKVGFSYAMNISLPTIVPDNEKEPSLYYINTRVIERPAEAAIFFEAKGTLGGFRQKSALATHTRFAFRNGEAVAVGFLDGHVETVSKTDFLDSPGSTWTSSRRNLFWTGTP